MRFFAFQKKPLFNRGFRREILKVAIFDPPQETPQNPTFWPFWPFWTPLLGSLFDPFLTPSEIPRKPQKRPFLTPPKTDPPQKSWKMALLAKTGVFKQDLNRKKGGGVGVYPGTPQKGHFWPFCPFWPFLPILAIFGHFWPLFDPPK